MHRVPINSQGQRSISSHQNKMSLTEDMGLLYRLHQKRKKKSTNIVNCFAYNLQQNI